MKNKLRILIAEDHETVREGFKLIVNSQDDMEVVGEAGDGRAAIELARDVTAGYCFDGHFDARIKRVGSLSAAQKNCA